MHSLHLGILNSHSSAYPSSKTLKFATVVTLIPAITMVSIVTMINVVTMMLPVGVGIAQSVQRPATSWTTEGSEFESR
jgi:hypothetical protein